MHARACVCVRLFYFYFTATLEDIVFVSFLFHSPGSCEEEKRSYVVLRVHT